MTQCSTLKLANLLGKKWTLLLIEQFALHKYGGFNELVRRTRMTPKVMAARLKEFEKAQLLKHDAGKSSSTTYILTPRGIELFEMIKQWKRWNEKYFPEHKGCEQRECQSCQYFKK